MDSLISQMRVRFSNVGQENSQEHSSFKDQRIPLQKTQSFKRENRAQNWLRRQFSRQKSGDLDSKYQQEHATAVAAAAYAIKSLEESHMPVQRKTSPGPSQPNLSSLKSKTEDTMPEHKKASGGPEPTMSRLKSKEEDTPPELGRSLSRLKSKTEVSPPKPGRSLNRFKSKMEDTSPEPGRVSKRFSGENATRSSIIPDTEPLATVTKDEKATEKAVDPPSLKKTTTLADELSKSPDHTAKSERTRSKVTDPGPSMTKTPTFAGERLNKTSSEKPEAAVPDFDRPPTMPGRTASKFGITPPIKPSTQPTETNRQSSTKPGTDGTKADAWERTKMAKIKERYEKLNETIVSWEERKKNRARRKLDKTQMQLEKRRVKALQKYRSNMESIDQIAGGARAQAQEKRRNEEFKAKEKASIIRTTGKLPATCFCF